MRLRTALRSAIVLLFCTATHVGAQIVSRRDPARDPSAVQGLRGAAVSGAVYDSIAFSTLAGAMVQLVSAESGRYGKTVQADWLGRFAFEDVPDGHYSLGFFHPVLDSLGLEPIVREVRVEDRWSVRTNLAVPTRARLRTAVCGPSSATNNGGLVMGVVRDAKGLSPTDKTTVVSEWVELSIGLKGFSRRVPRHIVMTKENGWYAICNAPSPGNMTLIASRGADSTDVIEITVPSDGFLRRDLHVGAARLVSRNSDRDPALTQTTSDSNTGTAQATATAVKRMRIGDGRLSGTVVSAVGGRPLAGAQVGIVNGPSTRANDRGEWTIADAPAGTRMLEVRAVGFYPERQPVEVIENVVPVKVALVTLKSVLDTVKVLASRSQGTRALIEFQERSRSQMGHFMTNKDILKLNPIVASDVYRMMPGVRLEAGEVKMRGGGFEDCTPNIYLNGHFMSGVTAQDLDSFVYPKDIIGIEIYASNPPPQFQPALSGCGSIVFWAKL